MVAQNCWEKYLAIAHNAMPLSPWDPEFQLLDVLVDESQISSCSCCWLSEPTRTPAGKAILVSTTSKVASLLTLSAFSGARKEYENLFKLSDEHIQFGSRRHLEPPVDAAENGSAADESASDTIQPAADQLLLHPPNWFSKHAHPDIITTFSVPASAAISRHFNALGSKKFRYKVIGVKSDRVNEARLAESVKQLARWEGR